MKYVVTEKRDANTEKTKKTKATKKANIKAKKVAEEQALKEKKEYEAKRKAEKEKYAVVKKRVQKSKPQFYLRKINIMATEYNEKIDYEFDVEVSTPSALTKLNNLIKTSPCYADTREAGNVLKRGRKFTTEICCSDNILIFDSPDIQVFAAKEVWLDFDGSWENRCEIRFSYYNNYKPNITYTHGTTFSEDTAFGADAYEEHSANGEAKWLRKSLGRPQ